MIAGSGKGPFSNPYLNTIITLRNLIEKERPELKEAVLETQSEKWNENSTDASGLFDDDDSESSSYDMKVL